MAKRRSWTEQDLRQAVFECKSVRQVIHRLGLVPAGENYAQMKKYISELNLGTSHFGSSSWNKGLAGFIKPRVSLEEILAEQSDFQSFKLKRRLFQAGLKIPTCEECGWAQRSVDGRLPLELDHINGNRRDNRLMNLRILCPNCHSLKPTHRGRNKHKITRARLTKD
ncbi:MAG: HNH endonuclease signature motif containing protein [Patescibacteria group bacterium]